MAVLFHRASTLPFPNLRPEVGVWVWVTQARGSYQS
jgi:hypothetical protein